MFCFSKRVAQRHEPATVTQSRLYAASFVGPERIAGILLAILFWQNISRCGSRSCRTRAQRARKQISQKGKDLTFLVRVFVPAGCSDWQTNPKQSTRSRVNNRGCHGPTTRTTQQGAVTKDNPEHTQRRNWFKYTTRGEGTDIHRWEGGGRQNIVEIQQTQTYES